MNNGELVPSHFVNYFFFIEIILYLVGVWAQKKMNDSRNSVGRMENMVELIVMADASDGILRYFSTSDIITLFGNR